MTEDRPRFVAAICHDSMRERADELMPIVVHALR